MVKYAFKCGRYRFRPEGEMDRLLVRNDSKFDLIVKEPNKKEPTQCWFMIRPFLRKYSTSLMDEKEKQLKISK